MSTNSFTQKILRVTLTLVDGTTFADKSNTQVLTGLRMSCEIRKAGHPQKNTCRLKVYGMSLETMNACTVVPSQQSPTKHPVTKKVKLMVEAGDADGLSVAFAGDISGAFADYKSPPNMYFQIEGVTGYYGVQLPAQATSFSAPTDVATVVKNIATILGYSFQNNGFSAVLPNLYLTGTPMEQLRQVAVMVPMEMQVDDEQVRIAPKNQSCLQLGQVPFLSPATGMKEYPIFDKHGIRVESIYVPGLRLGGQVKVQSDIKAACGYWLVNGLTHHLECLNPHGQWTSRISANPIKGTGV